MNIKGAHCTVITPKAFISSVNLNKTENTNMHNVVQWYSGTVVHWYTGTVVQWYTGTVVQWYTGTLVQWYTGTLVHTYFRKARSRNVKLKSTL